MSVKGGINWDDWEGLQGRLNRVMRTVWSESEATARGCSAETVKELHTVRMGAWRELWELLEGYRAPTCDRCGEDLAEDGSCERCADKATA